MTNASDMIEADTLELASITTGVLMVEPFSRVTELVQRITGFPVWTHQLPRVCEEIGEHIGLSIPGFPLQDAEEDICADWRGYADRLVKRFGTKVSFPRPVTEPVDPVREATDRFGADRVIVIDGGQGDE